MDSAFIQGLTILITIVGTVLAVSNNLAGRFNQLTQDISNLVTEQSIESATIKQEIERINEKIDDSILYRINANTELINHRTERHETSVRQCDNLNRERVEALRIQLSESREIVLGKLATLQQQIEELQAFLAKTTEFEIRN